MKDHRRLLKHVHLGIKPKRRAPHVRLETTEKPLCPHGCGASVQLVAETATHQLLSCNNCHSMVKISKEKGDVNK